MNSRVYRGVGQGSDGFLGQRDEYEDFLTWFYCQYIAALSIAKMTTGRNL